MKNKRYAGLPKKAVQKGRNFVRLTALCMFTVLFYIVFAVVDMIYSAADWAVRNWKKGGQRFFV